MTLPEVSAARVALLRSFRWHQGHADVWAVFADASALAAVVDGLAAPWADTGVTCVVGVEARGFLLGGAVALRLGVGFRAVRKAGALFPGAKLTAQTAPDYRGLRHHLALQDTLTAGERVLMVDDWAERGAQATAVRELVQRSGARFAGLTLMVDQLPEQARRDLGIVTSLVTAAELGDPGP